MQSRAEFEAKLIKDPFNADLRYEYAACLATQQDWSAAWEQYELLIKNDVAAVVGRDAARCLVRLGRDEEAIDLYVRSKAWEGFEEDEELESLLAKARPALRFSVIEGDRRDNVVAFSKPGREKVSFSDVAGMAALKKTLRLQIIEPFLNPGLFARFRKKAGGGVLMYGPPGCGKTMIARAIATECNAAYIAVGISDVLNMWLGESEKNLAVLFEKARSEKPCVLFFDELDALAYSRSKAGSSSARTVVNEFLAQLDGFGENNDEVLVLAATNMPWDVDPAMKRPGRFSKQVFVPPPDEEARLVMLEMKLENVPTRSLNLAALAKATNGYSGADIDGLIDNAKDAALAEMLDSRKERPLCQADFAAALESSVPSTIDWLKTARNLVKYAGADASYRDVDRYLRNNSLI